MKRVLYLLPVIFLAILACRKDHEKPGPHIFLPVSYASLAGKWELKAYYYSMGAEPTGWLPATQSASIAFLSDSIMVGADQSESRYTLIYVTSQDSLHTNDTILKRYNNGRTDAITYSVRISTDTLYLYNGECIEGCGEKYIKVSE